MLFIFGFIVTFAVQSVDHIPIILVSVMQFTAVVSHLLSGDIKTLGHQHGYETVPFRKHGIDNIQSVNRSTVGVLCYKHCSFEDPLIRHGRLRVDFINFYYRIFFPDMICNCSLKSGDIAVFMNKKLNYLFIGDKKGKRKMLYGYNIVEKGGFSKLLCQCNRLCDLFCDHATFLLPRTLKEILPPWRAPLPGRIWFRLSLLNKPRPQHHR